MLAYSPLVAPACRRARFRPPAPAHLLVPVAAIPNHVARLAVPVLARGAPAQCVIVLAHSGDGRRKEISAQVEADEEGHIVVVVGR